MSGAEVVTPRPETRDGFKIAVVCALAEERTAVEDVMTTDYKDEDPPPQYGRAGPDVTVYGYGELGGQPVVLACLADIGALGAAEVVRDMRHSFRNLSIVFLVGITGGAPFKADGTLTGVRLGDVIISDSMLKGDLGKQFEDRFDTTTDFNARLPRAAEIVRAFLVSVKGEGNEFRRLKRRTNINFIEHPRLKAEKYKCPGRSNDYIYASDHRHKHHSPDDCTSQICIQYDDRACSVAEALLCKDLGCQPMPDSIDDDRGSPDETKIHVAPYVSTDGVMKSAQRRDELVKRHNALGIEMEGPGIWSSVSTMVVKGVVDYADSHKNKVWRLYPAARAALCTKTIIELMDFGKLQVGSSIVKCVVAQPKPPFTIPFACDPDYIHRGPLVDQIHEKLSMPAARVALVGLGGVGKSQLAIDYAHGVLKTTPSTWVLWIHASSSARFELSVRDALEQLKVPGRSEPAANVFQLFRSWLRDRENGRWLIILDNADDATILVEPPSAFRQTQDKSQRPQFEERCIDYLPAPSHGSILATTRTSAAALKIVDPNSIVPVEPMEEEHAVKLIEKKLGGLYEQEDAIKLARALDFMPLAVVQAAAYIRQRAPRSSVRQYVEKLEKNERSRRSLLNREEEDLRRDREAINSIILTWEISFEHIRNIRPSAADLLSLMSFFDRQAIPEKLLRERGDGKTEDRMHRDARGEEGDAESSNEHGGGRSDSGSDSSHDAVDDATDTAAEAFDQDIVVLRSYSVISVTAAVTTFQMHRLVQVANRKWLESHKRYERWGAQFVRNLDDAFPDGGYENWAICESLFPHAMMALELKLVAEEAMIHQASLMRHSASYAREKGAYANAEMMGVRSVRNVEKVFGKAHPDTLTSMNNLALTYSNQGRWGEAEKLQVEVIEMSKKVLGEAHPDTLTSINNLALTYSDQGRWGEAEKLQVEVIEMRKNVLGEAHPDTLTSMNNLALTYSNQGRWGEAEKLQVEVIEMSKKVLGEAHPDTLTSMNNLASTYSDQGRWGEAEKLQVEVMEMSKKVLGEAHPETLTSMNNLALTYSDQGRWGEAEKLQVEVMEMRKKVLGEAHPDTLRSINNLASTYSNQGRWGEAEKLQVEVIEIRKNVLGEAHPDTLTSMNNLASTYSNQGRWGEAEKLQVEVIEIRKNVLGEAHPDTLTSMNNLASTYWNQGRWDEAEKLQVEVMEMSKKVLGEAHPDTLTSMANLSIILRSLDRQQSSLNLMTLCATTSVITLGAKHPDTVKRSRWTEKWKVAEEEKRREGFDSNTVNDSE